MLAKLRTFALLGIDAVPVEVEVDANPGTAKIILVGLPELAVRESVRSLASMEVPSPTRAGAELVEGRSGAGCDQQVP